MSTVALRLAGERKKVMLWIAIQGVSRVFKERNVAVSSLVLGESRPETACIPVGGITLGERRIDLEKLCAVGGELRVRLVQPRESTVLEDLFQPLKRKRTTLSATTYSRTSTAAIDVVDNTWAPTSGVIYMGAETIAYTGKSGTTQFTGITRAKYGSRAQVHSGSASVEGTAIFDVPPAWKGRRISLYASFLKDDGTTTAALTKLVGTYSIDTNPKCIDGNTWELRAGPISDEYAKKKAYVGMKDQGGGTIYLANATDEDLTVEVEDGDKFTLSAGGFYSHVLIDFEGGDTYAMIGKLKSLNTATTPNTITVEPLQSVLIPDALEIIRSNLDRLKVASIKHIALISGVTGAPILRVVTSRIGDAANGTYDVLPGRDPVGMSSDPWKMGAGIDAADVDASGFNNVLSGLWCYVLDDVVDVGDLLFEWCWLSGSFWYDAADGRLSAARFGDARATPVLTIGADMVVPSTPIESWVDEEAITPLSSVECNYSPKTRVFEYRLNTSSSEMMQRFPQSDSERVISLKSVSVDRNASNTAQGWPQQFVRPTLMTSSELSTRAQRMMYSNGRGRLMVRVACKLKALLTSLADVVSMGFDASDYAGGSVRGRDARVVGIRPDFDAGIVTLTLLVSDKVVLFAPSTSVTAVSTTSIANDTLTLSTTDPAASGASPADDFPVGAQVRLWDVSAGTSQVLTVAAKVAADKLRFTAGVVGAIEANRDWLTWNTLGTNTGLTSPSGYDEDDLDYAMPDSGAPAAGDTRRWR